MPIRVLVADDHAMYLRAVTLLLNSDPDIEVIATASDGAGAIELAMEHQPDVILMDLDMPHVDGIEATRQITSAAPHVAVIALTMFDDDDRVAAVMRHGAAGYVLKGARQDQLRRAVHAAHAGEAIFDATIAKRLRGMFAGPARPADATVFAELTDREREVLDQVAGGLDNSRIAERLFLSEKTVRNYVSMIFAKLHVETRAELIVRAREAGLGQ